jgi:hypothetical protein
MKAAYDQAINHLRGLEKKSIRLLESDELTGNFTLEIPPFQETAEIEKNARNQFATILGAKRSPRFFQYFDRAAEIHPAIRGFGKYPMTISVKKLHHGYEVRMTSIDATRPAEWGNLRFDDRFNIVEDGLLMPGRFEGLFQIVKDDLRQK